jgi:hypothetical protein
VNAFLTVLVFVFLFVVVGCFWSSSGESQGARSGRFLVIGDSGITPMPGLLFVRMCRAYLLF